MKDNDLKLLEKELSLVNFLGKISFPAVIMTMQSVFIL
jgi:hypothetical protein